jgi:hypothetical protein
MTETLVRVPVPPPWGDQKPQTFTHCPIARAIKGHDQRDILYPWVGSDYIVYSRKSTDRRYLFRTPKRARQYIANVMEGERDEGFYLTLDDRHFVLSVPRRHAPAAARAAATAASQRRRAKGEEDVRTKSWRGRAA